MITSGQGVEQVGRIVIGGGRHRVGRRGVLGGALGAATLGTATLGSTGALGQGVSGATPGGIPNLLLLGDSLPQGMFLSLTPVLRRRGTPRLTNGTRHATGITRADEYNWPNASRDLLNTYRPELAFFWIGANDFRPLVDREARVRYDFGAPGFEDAYARRVATMVENASRVNARAVWIGLPNMRNPAFATAAQRLNDIQKAGAESAGAAWLSIWDDTSDAQGRFSPTMPTDAAPRLARAEDGVHFTEWGYRRIARLAFELAATCYDDLAPVLEASALDS